MTMICVAVQLPSPSEMHPMKMPALKEFPTTRCGAILALLGGLVLQPQYASAEGIPEPSLVMYGVVTAQSAGGNVRVTTGTLSWQLRLSAGGPIVTVTTTLTNINDQFSYVVFVPLETGIAGLDIPTPNTLKLAPTAQGFDRSTVTLDGKPATFVQTSQRTLTLASVDRGRLERVDLLVVGGGCPDSDGNGLADCWELEHFGALGVDPNADADGDGRSNLQEFKAGTDPRDAKSLFEFITVESQPGGAVRVTWSSVSGKSYILDRSNSLLTGFAPLATGLAATAPINSYVDQAAVGSQNFYRLRLQE